MIKRSFIMFVSLVFLVISLHPNGSSPANLSREQSIKKIHTVKPTTQRGGRIVYISGRWVDSSGVTYYITQTKNRFYWRRYTKERGLDRGKGKVLGRNMTVTWRKGKRKIKVTGKITGIDKQGAANKIEWSNGEVFTRSYTAVTGDTTVSPPAMTLDPKVPAKWKIAAYLPTTLLMGDFTLKVAKYDYNKTITRGKLKRKLRLSGLAWVDFDCGEPEITPVIIPGTFLVTKKFIIVSNVTNPTTQVSLGQARKIQPDARLGGTLEMKLAVKRDATNDIIQAKTDYFRQREQELLLKQGDILVRFDKVIVERIAGQSRMGRIIQGQADFPIENIAPQTLKLNLDGFTAVIEELTLRPTGAVAYIVLQLPDSLASADDCGTAELELGKVYISPLCEFYSDGNETFGPWIIGETGMVTEGTGFVADFSSVQSPAAKPASWKGVMLKQGSASGATLVPGNSNTGYLTAKYGYSNGEVTADGFAGQLTLSAAHTFHPINPLGYTVTFNQGVLMFSKSRIAAGELQNGSIILPKEAVCNTAPANLLIASFTSLAVLPNWDLFGTVSTSGSRMAWGELTHPLAAEKLIAWDIQAPAGLFFLPGGAKKTFSPDTAAGFISFSYLSTPEQMYAQLKLKGMAGVTFLNGDCLRIFTPDRPGTPGSPIQSCNVRKSWLHVGSRGVNGKVPVHFIQQPEPLGNHTTTVYKGGQPFDAVLGAQRDQKEFAFFEFADSAVYDSEINGYVKIPEPSGIPALEFKDLETTSTAFLVGGDIMLGPAGEDLTYWKLKLASTNPSGPAGVMSVRTGRIAFTAARISEERHFDHAYNISSMIPFVLTWGEMLASGNFGHLFLNHNTYGGRFDKMPFAPANFVLSPYIPGDTNGYFDVCGTVHVGFFGSHYVNIRDARHDSQPGPPFDNRYVTVPDKGSAGSEPTDLHMHGEWNNRMAVFDFPDISMSYYEAAQDGFKGTGTSELNMVHSDPLAAVIEVHGGITDICFSSDTSHDLRYPMLATTLCGISELFGCVRIDGPLLQRIAMGGYMETSSTSGFGILAPKTGAYIETYLSITPTSSIFYAAGDMLASMAGSALDISGYTRLAIDHARSSAEGEVMGKIDCNSILSGLSGEGQMTWFLGPSKWYFQGKMKMKVCSWAGSAGLEGGLFVGNNVPKGEAWILNTGSEHFGVNSSILPPKLTGFYGYGQASFGVNWYIFGGGVEIYAGMGAFSTFPVSSPTLVDDWSSMASLGLPYVLGSAGVHVHGEILGGLVSASAWGKLDLRGPVPVYFSGTFGLEGCVVWVVCASVDVTAGISPEDGFFIY